jgi:hypothetical protein
MKTAARNATCRAIRIEAREPTVAASPRIAYDRVKLSLVDPGDMRAMDEGGVEIAVLSAAGRQTSIPCVAVDPWGRFAVGPRRGFVVLCASTLS